MKLLSGELKLFCVYHTLASIRTSLEDFAVQIVLPFCGWKPDNSAKLGQKLNSIDIFYEKCKEVKKQIFRMILLLSPRVKTK